MRTLLRVVFAMLIVSIGVAIPVYAGYKETHTVYIDLTNRYANGSLGDVRASGDTGQYVGCSATAWPGSSLPYAYCQAGNANWTQFASCTTQDAKLVASIQSMSSDAFVEFGWDTNSVCTYVNVQHKSYYAPKTP